MDSFNVMLSQQSAYFVYVKCWYGIKATPVGFSEVVQGFVPGMWSVVMS
jgi:hypothetical protein